jgi:succinoglycan biosynthesis transport protein ExoP
MFSLSRMKSKPAAAPAAPPASPAPSAATGEPDMLGLGRALWQKRATIVSITLIAATAALLVVNAITPQYRSESRLLLEARENVFLRAAADKNGTDRTTIDPEAVASQIQVVLSRDLAREVIRKENLTENSEFAGGAQSPLGVVLGLFGLGRDRSKMTLEERTMEAYYDHLNVQAVDKSRVIAIDFSSADPKVAARVANSIAETYLKMQQEAQQNQTRAAGTWLAGEIQKMRKRVAEAEAKVEQYRAKTNLFVGSNNTSLPSQQLTEINSQIAAARGRKADIEARARQLRDLIRSGKPFDSSDIANSVTMRRLIEQRIALRNQLAEQSTTLLPQHPRIKELKAQIAEINRQIRTEGERLARQLDNDAKVAGDRLQTLTASLDQVKKLASQTNNQDVQLRALEREAKTQRELLESYLAKYREASARDSIAAAPPEARIISRASPAIKPAYPKKLPTVLIAAFAALALSSGFIVTGALLAVPTQASYGYGYASASDGNAGQEPAPLPRVTSPPMTAAAPQPTPAASEAAAPMTVSDIDEIAAGLRQAGDAGRRVALVGTARHVGTTASAVTLARALAQDSSVVLVDLAFGAPNLSVLSKDPNAPGIAELVRGVASFGDIITRDRYSDVHLIATGEVGSDAAVLAASPMLATVVEALERSYDHVVIDAGSAADAMAKRFAGLADRSVLVTDNPADPATRETADRLAKAGFGDVAVLMGSVQAAAA